MAWICDSNGKNKCEVKKLSYNGTFMEVPSITVTIESPEPIDFTIGDYIDWDYDGLRYTLDTAAGVEKQARKKSIGNAFVYENLVFLSPLKAADNVDFLDVVIGNTVDFMTNTEFSFYGTAWDYAKRLEANLCRVHGGGSWKVRIWTGGTCYDSAPASGIDTGAWENKLVDVSGIKCLGGFQQVYDLWGCAYVVSVENGVNCVDFYDDFELNAKTWKSRQGDDKIFAYGKGNGLYKIRHTPDSDHVLVTRLRAYGSSDNLPANYYLNSPDYHVAGNESSELAISRLMLPASEWTKDGVKHPSSAYLEQNTDLYGVREGVVSWDGSDTELGEIKPTIYGLTIQDLLDRMTAGTSYRPVEDKWKDTSQRIDRIITGATPTDNGAVSESGYDFTQIEASGKFSKQGLESIRAYNDIDFSDLVMDEVPSVGDLAEYRIVPTSANVKVASFDVPSTFIDFISNVAAYLTPYVGGAKIEDASLPCTITQETIRIVEAGETYTRRYYIHLLDTSGNPIVFSTMRTGSVTFHLRARIDFGRSVGSFTVLRNEYIVSFDLLRGNKAIDKFFSVTIPQIGFDLAAAVTSDAKLCMRSGVNQPREFQIVPSSVRYDSATDTWYLRCKRSLDQSLQTYFPNSGTAIATGDEYYFTGIAMPSLYVEIAAQRLLVAAKAWLELHSKPRMLSAVDVDNKIMAVEGIVLKEGMSLPIFDDDLGITPKSQESRVIDNIRIEEGANAIRTFSITLRDKKEKSSLDAAIRGATSNFATTASVSDALNAIESKDHGSLSGRDMPNQHPITAITGLEEALAAFVFFEEDGDGNVKLKEQYGGLWTHGFLSSGGLSKTQGSSGLDIAAMWEELGRVDYDRQIDPSHLIGVMTTINADSRYVMKIGDTMSGSLGISVSGRGGLALYNSTSADYTGGVSFYNTAGLKANLFARQTGYLYRGVSAASVGYIIWDAENDGPDSGLDADLLDGYHLSDILGANVASASKLQNARTIWGQPFDGTANVVGTVNVGDASVVWANGSISGQGGIHIRATIGQLYLNNDTGINTILNGNNGGNVGIGMISPSYKLDVAGSIHTTDKIYIGNTTYYIEWDNDNGAFHSNAPFYSDSWVAAGGMSDSSGNSGIAVMRSWDNYDADNTVQALGTNLAADMRNDLALLTTRVTTVEDKATNVSVAASLTSGTRIATITVDGVGTDLYAPSSASSVSLTNVTGADDLKAIEALTGFGYLKRTGENQWDFGSVPYKLTDLVNDFSYLTIYVDGTREVMYDGSSSQTLYITSGSSGGYIGTTEVQSSSASQALTGITTGTFSDTVTVGNGKTAATNTNAVYRAVYFGSSSYYLRLDTNLYFHVNRGFYSDSFVSAGGVSTTSDARYKRNLQPVNLGLKQIADAPAVEFEWISDGSHGAGSIAQYWETILPYNIRTLTGERKTMEYGNIALLSAIVTARKVLDHEERIAKLENKLKHGME